MHRASLAVVLALALPACARPRPITDPGPATSPWRTIEVTNRFDTAVRLYPAMSGTPLWTRIGLVPPYATRRVRVPAAYLRHEFALVVCRAGSAVGAGGCVRTDPVQPWGQAPRVLVFPTPRLHAELY